MYRPMRTQPDTKERLQIKLRRDGPWQGLKPYTVRVREGWGVKYDLRYAREQEGRGRGVAGRAEGSRQGGVAIRAEGGRGQHRGWRAPRSQNDYRGIMSTADELFERRFGENAADLAWATRNGTLLASESHRIPD
jgi:hypothetical protein